MRSDLHSIHKVIERWVTAGYGKKQTFPIEAVFLHFKSLCTAVTCRNSVEKMPDIRRNDNDSIVFLRRLEEGVWESTDETLCCEPANSGLMAAFARSGTLVFGQGIVSRNGLVGIPYDIE